MPGGFAHQPMQPGQWRLRVWFQMRMNEILRTAHQRVRHWGT